MYELVTILGGQTDKTTGSYQTADYFFKENDECSDSLVLNAILRSKTWGGQIKSVSLIGTTTSLWEILVSDNPEADPEKKAFYDKLCQLQKTRNNIGDEDKALLEHYLEERFHVPFHLFVHSPVVNNDNMDAILSEYNNVFTSLDSQMDILVDITHGFRTMQLLLFEAMQTHAASFKEKKIKLLYGEYNKQGLSPVHDLSRIQNISNRIRQVNAFKETFSLPEDLLKELSDEYGLQTFSKWLKSFSDLVANNYIIGIQACMDSYGSFLAGSNFPEGVPGWVSELWDYIANTIYPVFDPLNYLSEHMVAFAKLLTERNLNMQAVMALENAIEIRTAECYYDEKHYRSELEMAEFVYKDYWWKGDTKDRSNKDTGLKKFRRKVGYGSAHWHTQKNLNEYRNDIAHLCMNLEKIDRLKKELPKFIERVQSLLKDMPVPENSPCFKPPRQPSSR